MSVCAHQYSESHEKGALASHQHAMEREYERTTANALRCVSAREGGRS